MSLIDLTGIRDRNITEPRPQAPISFKAVASKSVKEEAESVKETLLFRCDLTMSTYPGAHSMKKSASEDLFWCFRLSQTEDSIQYLEGPNGIWKHHDRHIFCPSRPQYAYHGPSRYHLVLPGTE